VNRSKSRRQAPAGHPLTLTLVFLGLLVLGTILCMAESIVAPTILQRDYGTNAHIRFASQTNIVYRIMTRTNLMSGSWRAIQAGMVDTTQTDVGFKALPGFNYYTIKASTLYPVISSSEEWYRTKSNPDYGLRIRGYLIYYPQVWDVALEICDFKTGNWKQVCKGANMPYGVSFTVYPRDVSPDNKIVVHGHDNDKHHPEREDYLYIRKVSNPNSKVVVTIPEPLEKIRFNEDKTITVNGQYTYSRDGTPQP